MAEWTEEARSLMRLANQEAQKLNHEYIGTEHILLAICREPYSENLREIAVNPTIAEQEVMKLVVSGPSMVTTGRLPQTPRVGKVLQFAVESATPLGLFCKDILVGLFRESEGVAHHVLRNLGVTERSFNYLENALLTPPDPKPPLIKRLQEAERLISAMNARIAKLEQLVTGETTP